jgi:hypothetical protein
MKASTLFIAIASISFIVPSNSMGYDVEDCDNSSNALQQIDDDQAETIGDRIEDRCDQFEGSRFNVCLRQVLDFYVNTPKGKYGFILQACMVVTHNLLWFHRMDQRSQGQRHL